MWTFTGYILWKFREHKMEFIKLSELAQFMFGFLWKRYNMVLNDSLEELKMELEYIGKLGYIKLEDDKVWLYESLKDFDEVVGNSDLVKISRLYFEYIYRINRAVEEFLKEKQSLKDKQES